MKDINKKHLTALVRSMKANLANHHGVTVPYSALRASYLMALGQNPHAVQDTKPTQQAKTEGACSLEDSDLVRKTLYLVEDEIGCLERLALDARGNYPVSQDWSFAYDRTQLVALSAEIPSINRYGLPGYLASPGHFFADQFGLSCAKPLETQVKDLGDDSGDSCQIEVVMPLKHWHALTRNVLTEQGSWDDLCESVGMNYLRVLESESIAQQVDWMERYLQSQTDDAPRAVLDTLEVSFEWLYPDQDSDKCKATLNLKTGVLTPLGAIPEDIDDISVDTRLFVGEECLEDPYPVRRDLFQGASQWTVAKKFLKDIRKASKRLQSNLASEPDIS